MLRIMQLIGLIIVLLLLFVLMFNGIVMLFSPGMWFRLPRFIALHGALQQRMYRSTTIGRLQVRLLGVVVSVICGWMLLWFFVSPYGPGNPHLAPPGVSLQRLLCTVPCLGAIVYGIVMFIKPQWGFERCFKGAARQVNPSVAENTVRILSLLCVGLGIYFLLQCFSGR